MSGSNKLGIFIPPDLQPYWAELCDAFEKGDKTRALFVFVHVANLYRDHGIDAAADKMEDHVDFFIADMATHLQNTYLSITKNTRDSKIRYEKFNKRIEQLRALSTKISEKRVNKEKSNPLLETTSMIAAKLNITRRK